MRFEKPENNVVPIRRGHEIREEKELKNEKEDEGDFLPILNKHIKKWDSLITNFKKILDDPSESDEDKLIVRRQIDLIGKERVALLFTMSRYRSYEEYKEKIEKILRIFRTMDGDTRKRANQSLQDMTLQLDDFLRVFDNYNMDIEAARVKELKEMILQGFLNG